MRRDLGVLALLVSETLGDQAIGSVEGTAAGSAQGQARSLIAYALTEGLRTPKFKSAVSACRVATVFSGRESRAAYSRGTRRDARRNSRRAFPRSRWGT